MEALLGNFVLMYLLLPIMAVVLGVVMMVIAKKNKLLSNKKFILFFLLTCVIITVPALAGFLDYRFMPAGYIILQLLYFLLGYYYIKLQRTVIKDIDKKPFYIIFLFSFITMLIGMGLFSLVFNLCNELKYGIWASTCLIPFIFPLIFQKAYNSYLNIPLEVYKTWSYGIYDDSFDEASFDYNKILVVELELFKQISDTNLFNIKAKASDAMPFGVWFQLFLNDYNKRSPEDPIMYEEYGDVQEWIFYMYTSILRRRRYIDPDKSFSENKIKEENVIIAKRVRQVDGEDFE